MPTASTPQPNLLSALCWHRLRRSTALQPAAAVLGLEDAISYQIYKSDSAPVRPAARERKWMDNAYQKFPYRCLPLVVANQYGWEILSTHHVRASWDGTSKPKGLCVENLYGDGPLHCHSHFGEG